MTKILLVEDDKSLREIYGVRLLAEGYDIVSAGDGEEALAMAIKEKPGLIVSDVMMPKISGFDMLDILRSTTETKDIKVIMMTALSSEDQRQRGVQLGANRYLVKSQVGIEDVVRTVHEVLEDMPGIGVTPTPSPVVVAPRAAPPAAVVTPPVTAPAPVAPAPIPQPSAAVPPPAASGLPQPTAPFSTTRPANLGDRVIHPLERPEVAGPNMADRISEELSAQTVPPVPEPPVVPSPQVQIPVTDFPAATPPAAPTPPVEEDSGLTFEETPLQTTAPQTAQQPPAPQL